MTTPHTHLRKAAVKRLKDAEKAEVVQAMPLVMTADFVIDDGDERYSSSLDVKLHPDGTWGWA